MQKDVNKDSSVDLIEYQIAIFLRSAINSNRKFGGIDRSAYLLLRQLKEHGSVGVKALSDKFHLDISTVSRQVAALESKQYVERFSDLSDGRAILLRLTALGLEKLKQAQAERSHRFGELLKEWSLEDTQKFGKLLKTLNQTLLEM